MVMITSFCNEYFFLSNFYPSPVKYEGSIYPTVEHAYQAAKTLDRGEREKVLRAKSAGKAKRLGGKVKLRRDWEHMKVSIMLELLRIKFRNEELRQQLIDTGDSELIEGNTWGDTFWGCVDGRGENWLGRLLMQVRREAHASFLPTD